MSRVLVLGGSGEMASVAVADLIKHTDHELTIGDIRPEVARRLLQSLDAPERVLHVDVDDAASLARVLRDSDLVLNATLMRHNVAVTDAAIAAGVHLVDLGSYHVDTLEQLTRHEAAQRAGCRIVPGCGVAPGLTNVIARLGADELDQVESIRMYSYITHPMWTSPGIVTTRFDASSGTSVVYVDGELVERPSFGDEERIAFPEPYGDQEVHLVPHPEPITLPRYIDVANVVFKVGYTRDENERIRVLLELGFDRADEFEVEGVPISPRRFTSAYVGSRGIAADARSANVKQVWVDGVRAGEPVSLIYDFAVEETGRSASSRITGTVAAIAADLVARGGPIGVLPPEAALPPRAVVDALARRGLELRQREVARTSGGVAR